MELVPATFGVKYIYSQSKVTTYYGPVLTKATMLFVDSTICVAQLSTAHQFVCRQDVIIWPLFRTW